METDSLGWFDWARAGLITAVLAVHGLYAAPVPHVVTDDDLRNPVTQDEIRRWTERLAAVGYAISEEEFSERLQAITGVIGGTHRDLKAPFRPVLRITGTGQGWALFANPDTHPGRLSIRVKRGKGDWEDLFLLLDPDHDWDASVLRYRRLRGCWDAGGTRARPRSIYTRFARWVSARAFEDLPEVDTVEVRTLRTHTTLPHQPDDPDVEVRHVIQTRRPH